MEKKTDSESAELVVWIWLDDKDLNENILVQNQFL